MSSSSLSGVAPRLESPSETRGVLILTWNFGFQASSWKSSSSSSSRLLGQGLVAARPDTACPRPSHQAGLSSPGSSHRPSRSHQPRRISTCGPFPRITGELEDAGPPGFISGGPHRSISKTPAADSHHLQLHRLQLLQLG